MATFVKVGEAAHDAERAALRFLQEGLPGDYFIFGNAWITEASGSVYELDAVVAAPHAFFVVEVKSYRARVTGNDNDWYVPHPIPSPLKLNRKTAQILKSALKRESYDAGRVWVQGLVFLSAASSVEIRGPASRDRVHTRKTILQAIKEPELVRRLSGRGVPVQASTSVQNELFRLLKGSKRGPAPVRRIREYELLDTLERGERFVEHHARNTLLRDDPRQQRVLRVYSIPALASDEQRGRVVERARWEAQVLGRLGRCPQILKADSVACLGRRRNHPRGISSPDCSIALRRMSTAVSISARTQSCMKVWIGR